MHFVIQSLTFLHIVNAWGLRNCMRGVYFVYKKCSFSAYLRPLVREKLCYIFKVPKKKKKCLEVHATIIITTNCEVLAS